MSNAMGNLVDVRICCKDWQGVAALAQSACNIRLPDRKVQENGECFVEFIELTSPHWLCLKHTLDEHGVRYDSRDLSEELPYWRINIINCKES